jgi:hypothetical protein
MANECTCFPPRLQRLCVGRFPRTQPCCRLSPPRITRKGCGGASGGSTSGGVPGAPSDPRSRALAMTQRLQQTSARLQQGRQNLAEAEVGGGRREVPCLLFAVGLHAYCTPEIASAVAPPVLSGPHAQQCTPCRP